MSDENLGPDQRTVLGDVTVIDLSVMMPGHLCTMILADLGARVISIERPRYGHPSRRGPTGYYESVNRSKESLSLDLKQAEAQKVLHRLVSEADVVVEGFRPGVAHRLSADYERLRTVRADLIYCSISGYGQNGPNRDVTGHDLTYLAAAGVSALAGDPNGGPAFTPGASMGDLSAAWYAAISILAALRGRDRFGVGQHLDVAIADTSLALIQSRLTQYFVSGRPSKHQLMARAAYNGFQTADGAWLVLAAVEDHFWTALCAVIGRDDWASDSQLATNEQRREHATEIDNELAAIFATRTREEWLHRLRTADIPCGAVNDLGDVEMSDQVVARQLFEHVRHSRLGSVPLLRFPVELPATPVVAMRPPPELGEHNASLLDELGVGAEIIAALEK